MRYILFITFLCLVSCKERKTTSQIDDLVFKETKTLIADSTYISEIWRLDNWTIVDNHLVISSSKSDSLFFIYSLPKLDFKTNFGRKGQGPEEFISARITTSFNKETFFVHDNGGRKMSELYVNDSLKSSYRTSLPNTINNFICVDSNIFCIKSETPRSIGLELRQSENNDFKKIAEYMILGEKDTNSSDLNFLMTGLENKVALAFFHKKKIEMYTITNGKNIERYMQLGQRDEAINNDIFEYSDMSSTNDCIYALYNGHISDMNDLENQKSIIEVINWDGQPLYQIELDRIINRIIVYTNNEHVLIYAMSPFSSDYIYSYTLK